MGNSLSAPAASAALDASGGRPEGGNPNVVEQDELQGHIGRHAATDRQERVLCLAGVGDDDRARTAKSQVEIEVGAKGNLHDAVERRGECPQARRHVGLPVVYDELRSSLASQISLLGVLAVAATRAPPKRASSMAKWPTAPAPPATKTFVPSRRPPEWQQ